MAAICILSTGQPSSNPRLVKEADALCDAGHDVTVYCAHWAGWADRADEQLLRGKRWGCRYVGGRADGGALAHAYTRLRHCVGRRLWSPSTDTRAARLLALSRVTPDLVTAAKRRAADLYIGHNLGALPAAVVAAERHGARAGFDAEDFHSGCFAVDGRPDGARELARRVEQSYLPRCDYVTAASPGIGAAYARVCDIAPPVTVLNVFPLAERASARRARHDGMLRLYWFSQTIGARRGLEDVISAMGLLGDARVELHLQGAWQAGYDKRLLEHAARQGVARERIVHHQPAAPGTLVAHAMCYDVGLAVEEPVTANSTLCLSNKLFTYLLAGNAIAATRTDAQARMAGDLAEAVALYEPGDAHALAAILSVWLEDRTAMEQAKSASWRHATRQYNWDVERAKLIAAVEHALAS